MSFRDLGGRSDALRAEVTVHFTDLFYDLWQGLRRGTPDLTAEVIEKRARLAAFEAFDLGAVTQHRDLTGSLTLPALLEEVGVTVAQIRANRLRTRALEVLSRYDEALISPYARLAASILVNDAIRNGTRGAGEYHGSRFKQFIRIRQVKEPRAHSVLEGQVLPVDELFNIGGYLVYGPGDENLPWSERAHCGHILRFIRGSGTGAFAMTSGSGGSPKPNPVISRTQALRRAEDVAGQAGVGVVRDAARFGRGSRILAAYDETDQLVHLNNAHNYWRDVATYAAERHDAGIWSTGDPLHVMHHEVGHALHQRHAPERFASLRNAAWSDRVPMTVQQGVSGQAILSPTEWVAEVYAALKLGKTLPDDILQLYNEFGGPPV